MEEEIKKAMNILIEYCNNTECENCIFARIHCECGINDPSAWEGVEENE